MPRNPIRFVTYSVAEGLSNRLRIHLIAHAYAIYSGARLLVDWPVVQACGARFGDLFEFADGVIDGSSGIGGMALSTLRPHRIRVNGTQAAEFRDVCDLPVPRAGLVDFGEVFRPFAYEAKGRVLGPFRQRVIDALRPVLPVRQAISALECYLPRPYLGIHIRRGDFCISFPDQVLGLAFYRNCMRHIYDCCPGLPVYLSCDDDEFISPLIAEFSPVVNPKRPRRSARKAFEVFGYANQCNRDTISGVREALVDLLMLSGSRILLAAPNSSFSAIAELLGGATLVLPQANSLDESFRCADAICASIVDCC